MTTSELGSTGEYIIATVDDILALLNMSFHESALSDAEYNIEHQKKYPRKEINNSNSNTDEAELKKIEYEKCYRELVVEFTDKICGPEPDDEIVLNCANRIYTLVQEISPDEFSRRLAEYTSGIIKENEEMDKWDDEMDKTTKEFEEQTKQFEESLEKRKKELRERLT